MSHSPAQIQHLLASNGLRPSRALGQNFVADPNTVRRIVYLAEIEPGDHVLEIGAGLGSLSLALADAKARVVALELDRYLLPVLRQVVEPRGVRVVEGDALRIKLSELLNTDLSSEIDVHWKVVANLPYNIATALVMNVLVTTPEVTSLLVMVQREVGERMAAHVGDKAYGSVSARIAYWAQASVVGRVPSSVFIPRPRVESVLVRITRHLHLPPELAAVSYDRLESLIRAGFAHRRQMLRRSLSQVIPKEAFEVSGVSSESRAEELSIEMWARLAEYEESVRQ